MKIKQKPVHIYAEIKRVNEEDRTFDAYAFVNEVVEGEGGMRLKRSAMEAATPDYMDWANVRRMHQADAIGVAKSVTWDENGAAMTVEVVDDDAWEKVKKRVYKGLSVGVAATVMRGKDVEACRWFETSLVDRPKDPDAKILAFRAEGIEAGEEFEAEIEEISRSFNDYLKELANQDLYSDLSQAWYMFIEMCLGAVEDAALMQQNLDEFAAYCKTVIADRGSEARGVLDAAIKRFAEEPEDKDVTEARKQTLTRLEAERTTVLERAETAETELARVQGVLSERSEALTRAEERVKTLEKMPVGRPPVRYPAALGRTFAANEMDGVDPERVTALQAKLEKIEADAKNEPSQSKRAAASAEYMATQRELQEMGIPA